MAAPERVVPRAYRGDALGHSNAVSVLLLEDADGGTLVDAVSRGKPLRTGARRQLREAVARCRY